jgi:hypothetical protein
VIARQRCGEHASEATPPHRRARSYSQSAFKGEPALRRSGRSLFQIAVESALDINLQEARQ